MKSTTLQIVCLMMILSGYLAAGASAGDKTGSELLDLDPLEIKVEGNEGPDGRIEPTDESVMEKDGGESGNGLRNEDLDRNSHSEAKIMLALGRGSSSGGGSFHIRGGNSGADGLALNG